MVQQLVTNKPVPDRRRVVKVMAVPFLPRLRAEAVVRRVRGH